VAADEESLRQIRAATNHRGRIGVAERMVQWRREMLALSREGEKSRTRPFEIQVMAIGGLAIVVLPGEVFVEYQLGIDEDSSFEQALVLGYTNGVIGYVPDAKAFEKGGYEVEVACAYYPGTLMITPECEGLIRSAARRLLARVASA